MDEERRAKRSSAMPVIVALIALPILYVLSIGPAAIFRRQGMMSQETFLWLYAPLALLYQFAPLGRLIDWYVSVWASWP